MIISHVSVHEKIFLLLPNTVKLFFLWSGTVNKSRQGWKVRLLYHRPGSMLDQFQDHIASLPREALLCPLRIKPKRIHVREEMVEFDLGTKCKKKGVGWGGILGCPITGDSTSRRLLDMGHTYRATLWCSHQHTQQHPEADAALQRSVAAFLVQVITQTVSAASPAAPILWSTVSPPYLVEPLLRLCAAAVPYYSSAAPRSTSGTPCHGDASIMKAQHKCMARGAV